MRDLSLQQLLTETLQRSLELDQWRAKSCFKIITADDTFSSRITATDSSDAFSVMISLHYHRISLLVHGAIVMRSLEYVSTTGPDFLAGIAGDTITSLLQRDLAAARDTHHIICDILQHRRGFLERTALWWICNYSGMCTSLRSSCNSCSPFAYYCRWDESNHWLSSIHTVITLIWFVDNIKPNSFSPRRKSWAANTPHRRTFAKRITESPIYG